MRVLDRDDDAVLDLLRVAGEDREAGDVGYFLQVWDRSGNAL